MITEKSREQLEKEQNEIRENIDNYTPNQLAYFTEFSIDFYREFRDRINFFKLYEIMDRKINVFFYVCDEESNQYRKRMKQIQCELLKWYYEKMEREEI